MGASCTKRWAPQHRSKGRTMHQDIRGSQGQFLLHVFYLETNSIRTSFSPLLSLRMETGYSQAPKTAASNSGILELATPSSCCRATRTRSFLLLLAHLAARSLLDLATCVLESGAISHSKVESKCNMTSGANMVNKLPGELLA